MNKAFQKCKDLKKVLCVSAAATILATGCQTQKAYTAYLPANTTATTAKAVENKNPGMVVEPTLNEKGETVYGVRERTALESTEKFLEDNKAIGIGALGVGALTLGIIGISR